ncbi:MAG: vWA domain-containing protein, partial [Acutalibacteraceae bacterium]
MKSFKRVIATVLITLMLVTSAPLSGFLDFDWSAFKVNMPSLNIDWEKINPFSSKAEATDENNNNNNNNNNLAEQENWTYKPKSNRSFRLLAADSSSSDEIEVTVKAVNKDTLEEETVSGATVTLYVGTEAKTHTTTDKDGVAKISIKGLTYEERTNATISAYKKVGEGSAIDGDNRNDLFSCFQNSSGDIIRYEYELHSETIDQNGNWLGEEIPKSTDSNKVDIVFAIDATGSMSDEITNVKNNIAAFSEKLIERGLDIRFSIIEYRDTTCGEETKVYTLNGSKWYTDLSSVTNVLSQIRATGGGDGPET